MSHVISLNSRVNKLNAFGCAICSAFFIVAIAKSMVVLALVCKACSLPFMLRCFALEDLAPGGRVVASEELDGKTTSFRTTISRRSTAKHLEQGYHTILPYAWP